MHSPESLRTCVGCRRRAPRELLVRCVLDDDEMIVMRASSQGRGAWLCRGSRPCLDTAIHKKRFAAAFRRAIPPAAAQGMIKAFASAGSDARESMSPGGTRTDLVRPAKG